MFGSFRTGPGVACLVAAGAVQKQTLSWLLCGYFLRSLLGEMGNDGKRRKKQKPMKGDMLQGLQILV